MNDDVSKIRGKYAGVVIPPQVDRITELEALLTKAYADLEATRQRYIEDTQASYREGQRQVLALLREEWPHVIQARKDRYKRLYADVVKRLEG